MQQTYRGQVHPFPETALTVHRLKHNTPTFTRTYTRKSPIDNAASCIFFLNHVDESRDKALKLASLRQLKSKANVNLPVEQPTVFI